MAIRGCFFLSSRRRHTRWPRDWSSDVCSSDLAEQAVADLNAKGGINGQKIELVFGDDASDPKQGVSVANKMAGDGVKFVIGHFNSGVTMPASEVYQENGIYMITPSATNPRITERNMWNVFRTCGRDDQQ